MVIQFTVELELSGPLHGTKHDNPFAKVGNAIADALVKRVEDDGLVPDNQDAYTLGITVKYASGELAAYRNTVSSF